LYIKRTNPETGSSDAKSFFLGFGGARLALLGLIGLDLQHKHTLRYMHTAHGTMALLRTNFWVSN